MAKRGSPCGMCGMVRDGEQVASVGPEVQSCAKNFPRAILSAAGMQTVINGIIHLVASGATDPALYPEWEPGYLRYYRQYCVK